VLEIVGPTGPEVSGGWFFKTFRIRDVIPPTNQMRLRFTASDLGSGSVVEAGVDGVSIQVAECSGGSTTVTATSFTALRGLHISGTLSDTFISDDSYLKFNPGITLFPTEPPVWIVFDGTLPVDNPSALAIILEASADTVGLTQTMEVFNWNTGQYQLVDSRTASFNNDAVTNIDVTSSISNFVQPGTGAIRSRMGWRATGPVVLFPWTICIDQFVWSVE
jgi:hypothetical protein